jgi:hypothetical protein
MTHILELLQNIIPLLVEEGVLVATSIAIIARVPTIFSSLIK